MVLRSKPAPRGGIGQPRATPSSFYTSSDPRGLVPMALTLVVVGGITYCAQIGYPDSHELARAVKKVAKLSANQPPRPSFSGLLPPEAAGDRRKKVLSSCAVVVS